MASFLKFKTAADFLPWFEGERSKPDSNPDLPPHPLPPLPSLPGEVWERIFAMSRNASSPFCDKGVITERRFSKGECVRETLWIEGDDGSLVKDGTEKVKTVRKTRGKTITTRKETPWVNGAKAGMQIVDIYKSYRRQDMEGFIRRETLWVNGQKEGIEKVNALTTFPIRDKKPIETEKETPWVSGKKHGVEKIATVTSKGGKRTIKLPWMNGKKHGCEEVSETKNGSTEERRIPWMEDRKHGAERRWTKENVETDGIKITRWKDDLQHGVKERKNPVTKERHIYGFYGDGRRMEPCLGYMWGLRGTIEYVDKDGASFKTLFQDGEKILLRVFSADSKVVRTHVHFHDNRSVRRVVTVNEAGHKHYEEIEYYRGGNKKSQVIWRNGVRDGEEIGWWSKTGKVKYRMTWSNGKKTGSEKHFRPNGNCRLWITWDQGKKVFETRVMLPK